MDRIPNRKWRRVAIATASLAIVGGGTLSLVSSAGAAGQPVARATLLDAQRVEVGTVKIHVDAHHTTVSVRLNPNANVTPDDFHGFHIHANNDPANGDGCIADPDLLPATWFVSADGHYKTGTETHGDHQGDMPSLLVGADGSATATFITDRISPSDIVGRAIILHKGPDNFGNVPVGTASDQYTANSPGAITKTQNTGNAGDRVACGVITANG
jgi:Cu-Zn family superoxide dismutase